MLTHAEQIAEAVADPEWQKFRMSLKGISTKEKLHKLLDYYSEPKPHENGQGPEFVLRGLRVDNYLKALARGGLIEPSDNYMMQFLSGTLQIRR